MQLLSLARRKCLTVETEVAKKKKRDTIQCIILGPLGLISEQII
jgi:hypothetical protein